MPYLYVVRTGCQWRMLPHDLPPWKTVYWYFMTGRKDGTLDRLHDGLRCDPRRGGPAAAADRGRARQPVGQDDRKRGAHGLRHGRRSMTGAPPAWLIRGADPVRGGPAGRRPGPRRGQGGAGVARAPFCWVRKVWADGAYAGQLVAWVAGLRSRRPVELEIVKRSEGPAVSRCCPTGGRWNGRRLGRSRRLSKD